MISVLCKSRVIRRHFALLQEDSKGGQSVSIKKRIGLKGSEIK